MQLSSVYGISYVGILMNGILMAFLPIPLMAKMVEKSRINSKRTRLTRLYLIFIQILTTVILLVVYVYSRAPRSLYRLPLFVLPFMGVTALNVFLLLVINAICNSYIMESEELEKLADVKALMAKSMQLVNRLRLIKTAFNPLLFIMLPFNVIFSLILAYSCYFYLVEGQLLEALNKACMLAGIGLNIFYYTQFCHETHSALSNNNDNLR